MADPRGLSGAVFQPLQMRDFTKDIALGREMKSQAQEAEQNAYDSYLEQYGVEIPNDVPYPYQEKLNNLINQYKQESNRVYSLKGTPEYGKELAKLKSIQEGVKSAINGAKYRFAASEAADRFAQRFSEKLSPKDLDYATQVANEGYNPQGDFNISMEEGAVYWNDKPVGEAFRVEMLQPPVEDVDPFNAMISQEEVDVSNWGQINSDGSVTFAPYKAMRFLDTEKRLNSKYYLKLAKQVIGRSNLDDETTISMLQDDKNLVNEVDDIFLRKAESRFKEVRGYKDADIGGDEKITSSSIVKTSPISGESKEKVEQLLGGRHFQPNKKININYRTTKDGKTLDFDARLNGFRAHPDGKVYADISFLNQEGGVKLPRIIELNDSQIKSLENQLGTDNILEYQRVMAQESPESIEKEVDEQEAEKLESDEFDYQGLNPQGVDELARSLELSLDELYNEYTLESIKSAIGG